MTVTMLKSKIHRATVKQAEIDYVGSITVDPVLMEAAGIFEYEKVAVVDVTNGARLETYIIEGERDSGMICLNGAAAQLINKGIIYSVRYGELDFTVPEFSGFIMRLEEYHIWKNNSK